MRQWLVLPVLIPMLTAALSLLAWRWARLQRALAVSGAAALFAVSLVLLYTTWEQGVQAVQIGGWPAPFGITVVADLLSGVMVALAGLIGLAVTVYSWAGIDDRRMAFGYYPLLHILLMGVCGAFLTGDIFNLYVWFEVMLIASFVLLVLGGEQAQVEGGFKYVTLNLLSSAIFLAAIGLLYGAMGTLNLADLAVKLRSLPERGLITAVAMLFLVAFGIKAAIFPLFFWLPASYHTPPAAVSAIFAGLLTKVGVYALVRTFTLLFVQDAAFIHGLMLVLAGLTMISGILGALAQDNFRRLLSFVTISEIGFLLMGLGIFTVPALAGTVMFMVNVVLATSSLFLISGMVERLLGSYQLGRLGGLYRARPGLAVLFLLPALSLGGIPPFAGFFGKLALIQAGFGAGQYLIVGVSLVASVLTLLPITTLWSEVFWKPLPQGDEGLRSIPAAGPTDDGTRRTEGEERREWVILAAPVVVLAALTLLAGAAAEPLYRLATAVAQQLLDPTPYIRAVLGG